SNYFHQSNWDAAAGAESFQLSPLLILLLLLPLCPWGKLTVVNGVELDCGGGRASLWHNLLSFFPQPGDKSNKSGFQKVILCEFVSVIVLLRCKKWKSGNSPLWDPHLKAISYLVKTIITSPNCHEEKKAIIYKIKTELEQVARVRVRYTFSWGNV